MNVDEDVVLTHVRWLVRWFDGELLGVAVDLDVVLKLVHHSFAWARSNLKQNEIKFVKSFVLTVTMNASIIDFSTFNCSKIINALVISTLFKVNANYKRGFIVLVNLDWSFYRLKFLILNDFSQFQQILYLNRVIMRTLSLHTFFSLWERLASNSLETALYLMVRPVFVERGLTGKRCRQMKTENLNSFLLLFVRFKIFNRL